MRLIPPFLVAVACLAAEPSQLVFLKNNRPVLDAHNCYPYEGQYADRIDRALKTGFPVGIEQDIAWGTDPRTGKRQPVVSHTPKTKGDEPSLREHFFERVRPIVEKALKENDRARWPLIVLHFDFKSLDPELLQSVWELTGEYEDWITTAPQTASLHQIGAFDPKPLLVLTEEADEGERIFFRQLPPGAKLRIFGSARTTPITAKSKQERNHLAATLRPSELLREAATNYRRWWNTSWFTVEEGGQAEAGEWTAGDARRLHALVDHAHKLGYWIRFYTLDGFAPAEDRGWGASYNFGSREAVAIRWKAAYDARVNLIAADQYEDLAAFLRQQTR